MRSAAFIPTALSASVLLAPPAQAAIIIGGAVGNGNFESPDVSGPSGTQVDPTGTAIPGWAIWVTDNNIGVYDSPTIGSQVLFIQGGGSVRSTTTFIAQVGDQISFSFSNVLTGRGSATMQLVWNNGGTWTSFGPTIAGGPVNTYSGSYTVQAGDAIVGQAVGVGFNNIGNFPEIDNVTLEVTPVPEPGIAALGALGIFGLLRRRRA